jgi:hypothetical protein
MLMSPVAAELDERVAEPIQPAEQLPATLPAAPVQRQRLVTETRDWALFLDPETLQQRAGCQPHRLRQLVLREIVDNALDVGAQATLHREGDAWVVTDNGPGLDPERVPELFAVNRPLISDKALARLPLRGMLGNGLRVVVAAAMASEGALVVETRGHRLRLGVDRATGDTTIISDQTIPLSPGLVVRITFGEMLPQYATRNGGKFEDDELAKEAIHLSKYGSNFNGLTSPWWYSAKNLHDFMNRIPSDTMLSRVCEDFGVILNSSDRLAGSLSPTEVMEFLDKLRRFRSPVKSDKLGAIGPDAYPNDYYSHKLGCTRQRGMEIPYIVECWAYCWKPETRGQGRANARLLLNRTPSAALLRAQSYSDHLHLTGCGLDRTIKGKTGEYSIIISVITPYVRLAGDGKEPALASFGEGIDAAVEKACRAAHNAMEKPAGSMSIVDAANQIMVDAYNTVSDNGRLPANARQIFYVCRPLIMQLTGRKAEDVKSGYFTQRVLPDYIDAHPDSWEWDVPYDDRGHFTEPHTGRSLGLGTIAVREYLGERQAPATPASIDPGLMANTTGPENRYKNVLFVEKEGFNALISQAMIAERFDLLITSSKGLPNTSVRQLIDGLMKRGMERVFVLHDFDASGFSIFGTLGTDSRRYKFINKVNVIDLGLRLSDIEDMGLDHEEYKPEYWSSRIETIRRHGATEKEINFLEEKRVELNAMTSVKFIEFLERKLVEQGVQKLIPDANILVGHARHIIERALANSLIDENREDIDNFVAVAQLPEDLHPQVANILEWNPKLPWDLAVAQIANELLKDGEDHDPVTHDGRTE